MTSPLRVGVAAVAVVTLLVGCVPLGAAPTPSDTFDYDIEPPWREGDDVGETRMSFARGTELTPTSRVEFRSRLGDVYDWAVVGTPTENVTEFVNENAGCRVRDETSAYAGDLDDETASRELVTSLLGDAEVLGGPQRSVGGIGDGLGEGAPMYDVMHALGADPDGGYVYVTGRVFASAGIQHSITVHCELGGYVDRTRGQLATTTWVVLDLPENVAPPAVTARPCTRDDLTIEFEPFAVGATTWEGLLHLRNTGGETCSLSGYPIVHLSSPESAELWGPAAAPDPAFEVLARDAPPGWEGLAHLTITLADSVCPGATMPTDGLVVAPPGGDAVAAGRFVPVPGLEVCADQQVALLKVGGLQV